MHRIFKLFVAAAVLGFVAARLRRRSSALPHSEAPEFRGIADVDPQPLTQFGDAVDPDALQASHAEPVGLGDQLPRPGKNLP